MKKSALIAALFLLLSVFAGCGRESGPATKTIYCMDTVMTLTAYGKRAGEAVSKAEEELFRLDAILNRHNEKSGVSFLNRAGFTDDAEIAALMARCDEITALSGGAFDVTIAPVLDCWDFASGGRVPAKEEISAALALTGMEAHVSLSGKEVSLSHGSAVDFGGAGKGYAGERVREIFVSCGVTGGIGLGGDACVTGGKPDGSAWRIGVRDPRKADGVLAVLTVSDTFVVTSGSYERNFKAEDGTVYHHIMDPATGCPAESGLVSVTVLSRDGVQADALATALFVLGEEKAKAVLAALPDVSAILVTDDGRVLYSRPLESSLSDFAEGYAYEAL